MKMQITEQQIKRLSQQYLKYTLDNIDDSVHHQLSSSRLKAIQRKNKQNYTFQWQIGFSFASLLMIMFFWQTNIQQIPTSADDFLLAEEIILIEENQDIVNDLDFYQWLDKQYSKGELV